MDLHDVKCRHEALDDDNRSRSAATRNNTRTPMMALPACLQQCSCMPELVWHAGNPGECKGKRDRTAWDRCVGFQVNAA